MAQAVNVNFRMDADLKRSMEETCSELGMSMTTAFIIFAKKVSREKRIPFEVSVDPMYSEAFQEARRIAADPSVKGYTTMEELIEALEEE